MKCKVLCYLLCVLFCFSSLGLSSSAADGSSGLPGEPVYPLVDDLIEEGFVMDEAGDYVYYGNDVPFNYSTFLISRKNFPDFDIKSLPWLSFPVYVKEILSLDTGSYMPVYTDDGSGDAYCFDRIPFMLIRPYAQDYVEVYCGYNIAIASYNDADWNLNLFAYPGYFYNGCACYYARYDFSGNVLTDWYELDFHNPWANKDLGYFMTYAIGNLTRVSDYYFWGGNSIKPGSEQNVSSFSFLTDRSNPSSTMVQGYQSVKGFKSGYYFFGQDAFQNAYCTTFTPPSEEELNHETSKGIFETLKEVLENIKNLPWLETIWNAIVAIPDRISGFFIKLVEDIKGLFLPGKGFFDAYTSEFRSYFSDKLGLLYELPESVITLFSQLVDYEPVTEGYGIDFPEVKVPILQNGKWEEKVFIEETRYEFDFLDEGPISTLYSMYRSALWIMFIFLLINLIIRKSNKVFGGGPG